MSEYDYTPEASEHHIAAQRRIAEWAQRALDDDPANTSAPIPAERPPRPQTPERTRPPLKKVRGAKKTRDPDVIFKSPQVHNAPVVPPLLRYSQRPSLQYSSTLPSIQYPTFKQVYQPSSAERVVGTTTGSANSYVVNQAGQNVQMKAPQQSYAYPDHEEANSDSDLNHTTPSLFDGLSLQGVRSKLRSRKSDPETIVVPSPQHTSTSPHREIKDNVNIGDGTALSKDLVQGIKANPIPDPADSNEPEHSRITACWIAAEHALQHARSNTSLISKVFDEWKIAKSQYTLLVGFDESLIESGVGYLEQIHIFVSADVDGTSPLLLELGKILSPFSSILFTNSSSHHLPVFKDNGNVWEPDELVYATASKFADGGFSAKTPLTVIGLSQSPSLADGGDTKGFSQGGSGTGQEEKNKNKRSGKGKGKENDREDEDEPDKAKDNMDPHGGPGEPSEESISRAAKISFAIVSKLYPVRDKLNAFQSLTMDGVMTIITTTPVVLQSPDPFSTRRVQFTELAFGTERNTETAYRQFYVRVTVNSQEKNAGVMDIRPRRTLESEREEKQSSATKRGRTHGTTVGLSIAPDPHASITGAATTTREDTAGVEKKRYTSRITEQHNSGIVRWGFNVDDLHEQERGIDMSRDVLPTARFEFVGDPTAPPPPPARMVAEIASYWSIIPRTRSEPRMNWIRTILNLSATSTGDAQGGSYSNLCQVLALETVPSDLPPRFDYRATTHVSPGVPDPQYISYYTEVELSTADSVTVTPASNTDDWRKPHPAPAKLPQFTNFKLSEHCRQNLEKPPPRDSKIQ